MNSTVCDWTQSVDRPVRLPLLPSTGWPQTTDRYSPQSPTHPGFRPLSSLSPGSSSTSSNGGPIGESLFNCPARHQWLAESTDPMDAVTEAMRTLNFSSSDESGFGTQLWSYLGNSIHQLEPPLTSRRTTRRPPDCEQSIIDPYFVNSLLFGKDASRLDEVLLQLLPCISYMTAEATQVYIAAISQFVTAVFSNQVRLSAAVRVFYSFANDPSLLPKWRLLFGKLLRLITTLTNPLAGYVPETGRHNSEPAVLASCRRAAANGWIFPSDVRLPRERESPAAREGGHFAYGALPQAGGPLNDYATRSAAGASSNYPSNSGISDVCCSLSANGKNEGQCPGEKDIFSFMSQFNSRSVSTDGCPQREEVGQSGATTVPAGMRDVPQWLKVLRLHKYAEVFVGLSYQEMLSLDERSRRLQMITSGARKKLSLSIQRLRRRATTLKEIEMGGFLQYGSMKASLAELKAIAESPICPYREIVRNVSEAKADGFDLLPDEVDDRNIPAHLTRVLGKACTQLKAFSELDEESITVCCEILERCILHEAFTTNQKKRLTSWKQELRRAWYSYKKNLVEQRLAMERPVRHRRGRGSRYQNFGNDHREATASENRSDKQDFGRRRNKRTQRSNDNGSGSRATAVSSCYSPNGRNDREGRRRNQTEANRNNALARSCTGKGQSNRRNRSNVCHNTSLGDHSQQVDGDSRVGNDQNGRSSACPGMLIRDGWTYSKEHNSNHFAFN